MPAPLQYTFQQELLRLENEKNMSYITSIERMGREEALKKGPEEGRNGEHERSCQTLRELILKRHQQRWGQLEAAAQARLQKVGELARLGDLLAEFMTASSSQEWKSAF